MARVVVGQCPVCGKELKAKEDAIIPKMQFTCACGERPRIEDLVNCSEAGQQPKRRSGSRVLGRIVEVAGGLLYVLIGGALALAYAGTSAYQGHERLVVTALPALNWSFRLLQGVGIVVFLGLGLYWLH